MKSSFYFLACFLLINVQLIAQDGIQNLRIGAKAGINVASFAGDGAEDVKPRLLFHIGGFASADILEQIGVQAELFFTAQGGKEFSNSINSDVLITTTYLSLPFLGRYTIFDGLAVFVGPQFSANITSKAKVLEGTFKDTYDTKDDTPGLDVAIVLGGSYEIIEGLHGDLRFVIGLVDTDRDSGTFYHRVVQIGVAYDLFNQ